MSKKISASMLYGLVECRHRLFLDIFEDPAKRDPVSKFVKLLWEKGIDYENEVVQGLDSPFLNLSFYSGNERLRLTHEAMESGQELIYGGRLAIDDLIGDPDFLRKKGHGYIAGDIKSGAGLEGESDFSEGKPKKNYAVQLGLYTDILERLGKSAGKIPFILDIHGREIVYDLNSYQGPRTPTSWWEEYKTCLDIARKLVHRRITTMPALSGVCKLCHWRTVCLEYLHSHNDLSLIPGLGCAKRDAMYDRIKSVSELAEARLDDFIQGKTTIFPGIGVQTLKKFYTRAKLLIEPQSGPYLTEGVRWSEVNLELFFDIETDPMRDVCYLYGFLERHQQDKSTEQYFSFFAESPTPEDEEHAFAEAWEYIAKCRPCAIYFYSSYEKTQLKKLREKYTHIATKEEIDNLFNADNTIDLYSIVSKKTEWPTNDHSIKTLASYLGFKWRDDNPSGAESVEWYHQWVDTKSDKIKRRILEYNEDDCIAMRVLLEGIRNLSVRND